MKEENNNSTPLANLDTALRPRTLQEYFFQGRIKPQLFSSLQILLQAAQERGEPLDHILFYGPPGLGKTTLAQIIAHEMQSQIKVTSGPVIERVGDLAAILSNLNHGDILFIDEIHRLRKNIEEIMYAAMEDFALDIVLGKGPSAQTLRLELPRFTIIGATTRISLISAPLRDRFGVIHRLQFFSPADLTLIIKRSAQQLQLSLTDSACREIARRARGTPRIANRLLKRLRDYSQIQRWGKIDEKQIKQAFDLLGVDEKGLTTSDRHYLQTLIEKFNGGPVGLKTISSALAEDQATIEEVVEPFLLQLGLIKRTPRGRHATPRAYQHLQQPLAKKRLL